MFFLLKQRRLHPQQHPCCSNQKTSSLNSLAVLEGDEFCDVSHQKKIAKTKAKPTCTGCGLIPRSPSLFGDCGASRRSLRSSSKHGMFLGSDDIPGDIAFPTQYDPKIKLETYSIVLSLNDINLNAIGMEKLLQAARPPPSFEVYRHEQKDVVAQALIYGGEPDSPEEELRFCFLRFLSDEYPSGFDDETESCSSDEEEHDEFSRYDEDDEEDDDDHLRGANWGALHLMALKVIGSSLEQILATAVSESKPPDRIDFRKDAFWPCIMDTLRSNVEMNHSSSITRYSVKCLRLLCSVEPFYVKSLMQHCLMPHIMYLQECGGGDGYDQCGRIQSEASRLLKRAEIFDIIDSSNELSGSSRTTVTTAPTESGCLI